MGLRSEKTVLEKPRLGNRMNGRRHLEGRWIRWDDGRAEAAYAAGHWTRRSLGDVLRQAAQDTPARVLLVAGDRRIDCVTMHREASALAQAMLQRLEPGSVVSFMLPNWPEAATIYLAAQLAGMVANPILPSLRDRELRFVLDDLRCKLLFIPAHFRGYDYVQMLNRVVPELAAPPSVVVVRGEAGTYVPFASLFESVAARALPTVEPDAARLVLYTSGTTGTAKGVLHSQNSIHALVRQLGRYWHVAPGDAFYVASPISHIGGSIYAFECPLYLGTRAVLADKWDADAALEVLQKERCTHMAGATPFLQQLLAAARRADTRLSNLKVFICGGASVPPSLIRDAAGFFEHTIFTRVYGSTEVPVTTVGVPHRDDLMHAAETDGRVGFAEVKLVAGGSGAEEGEIHARGPQMLIGYVHPEDEGAVFDDDGFYRSGDLGRWVDRDYLVVSGRSKDIIIRKGENISPKEVEDYLLEHPDIVEVAVVGLPDQERGERACAVIVAKPASAPDVAQLRSFLTKLGVAAFKIPEQVMVVSALPKNDTGKVLKHQIRALLMQSDG
jgi:acyl-CoA synthetase (AMP-forming)/AMP-acid ligase II